MQYLLFAIALVMGDLYARNKFRVVGNREVRENDTPLIRFLQRYETAFRIGGLMAIFGGTFYAGPADGSVQNYLIAAPIIGAGILALISATAWPLLRWHQ